MIITIESTTKLVKIAGVPVRIWEGHTEGGIPVHCYITRVAVAEGRPADDYTQFEQELQQQKAPSAEIAAIPLRMIL